MGFHQAGHDAEVCIHEAAVELDRSAPPGAAQVDVVFFAPGKVVLHCHGFEDPGIPHQIFDSDSLIGAVEACSHENLMRRTRAGGQQRSSSSSQTVGHRAGDVTD